MKTTTPTGDAPTSHIFPQFFPGVENQQVWTTQSLNFCATQPYTLRYATPYLPIIRRPLCFCLRALTEAKARKHGRIAGEFAGVSGFMLGRGGKSSQDSPLGLS